MHTPHPLLAFLTAAADDRFPPVDGTVTVLPPLHNGWECSVAFTGHAVVATSRPSAIISSRADGFGRSMSPDFLRYLAGPTGFVGDTDVMLVGRGTGTSTLPRRTDADDHPRVQYALDQRTDVTVYGDERGLITLANGLAGRRELSVEAAEPNRGWGRALIAEGLGLVPSGELLFAAVSPGNARSLRTFLGLGFVPIGSEVLIRPAQPAIPQPSAPTP
jgi:hypothetical protein